MTDLNTLVPAGTGYTFNEPAAINSRGEIVGLAVQTSTGLLRAFLLTPCGEGDASCADTPSSPTNRPDSTVSGVPGGMPGQLRGWRFPGRRALGPVLGPAK